MPKKNEKKNSVKKLPYNIDNEQFLLGEILIDSDTAADCIPRLKPLDFFDENNATIFDAMVRIQNSNKKIDFLTVIDELRLMGKLEEVGGEDYITGLTESVVSTINAPEHLKMVKRDSILRQIVAAGNNICEVGYSGKTSDEAMLEVEKEIRAVSEGIGISSLEQCSTMAADALKEIQDAQNGDIPPKTIFTGYKHLDKFSRGLKPGSVTIIAARPGIGKTSFALNIATNVAIKYKKRVAFFSLEMSSVELCKRMLSQISWIDSELLDTAGSLTQSDYLMKKLLDAFSELSKTELYIDDFSMNTPTQIFNKCKRLERNKKGLDLVVIDYLQLMGPENAAGNRQEVVSDLSRSIKVYAQELGIPIIVLAQLNRKVEEGNSATEERKPQLSDLRESGSIEQDADMVLFLHVPKGVDTTQDGAPVELIVGKNRRGKRGKVNLLMYSSTCNFVENPDQGDNVAKKDNAQTQDLAPINEEELKKKLFVEENNVKDDEFSNDDTSDGDLEI